MRLQRELSTATVLGGIMQPATVIFNENESRIEAVNAAPETYS
jgi:hypothetical protein